MAGLMEGLRARAARQLVGNLQAIKGAKRPARPEARARRWWDLPAKVEIAERIARGEAARAYAEAQAAGDLDPHNDRFDAARHARTSQRLAEAAGPIFAELAGTGHEVENVFDQLLPAFRRQGAGGPYAPQEEAGFTPGQVIDEIRMDLHNNAVGRAAAREGRPIEPSRLRTAPATAPATALSRSPPAGRTGLPPR